MLSELDKKYLRNRFIQTVIKKRVFDCVFEMYGEILSNPAEKDHIIRNQSNKLVVKDKTEGKFTPYLYIIITASSSSQKFYYEYEIFSLKKYFTNNDDLDVAVGVLKKAWEFLMADFMKCTKK